MTDDRLPPDSVYASAVRQHITNAPTHLRADETLHNALKRFYERRNYQLAWGANKKASMHHDALTQALKRMPDEGIDTTATG